MLKRIVRKIKTIIGYFLISCKRSKYLFIGSPSHGNLGDHAIAICSMKFLNNNSVHKYKEITFKEYYRYKKYIFSWKPKTIVIIGGGNMGDLWPIEEDFHLDVIKTFLNAKIIVLPQSIWFENNLDGNKYLLLMKDVYNSHKNLHLFAREKFSFAKMKEFFPNNHVYLTPDMVLTSKRLNNVCLNQRLLVLKRMDKEGDSASAEKIRETVAFFSNKGYDVEYSDTVVKESINPTSRKKHLHRLYNKIRNSSLVVTDRLHGMVFSFINKTPVIVFSNNTLKIEGTYDWLKEDHSILFSPDQTQILSFCDFLLQREDYKCIYFDYSELRRVLNE